jgi:hypothetical protein
MAAAASKPERKVKFGGKSQPGELVSIQQRRRRLTESEELELESGGISVGFVPGLGV